MGILTTSLVDVPGRTSGATYSLDNPQNIVWDANATDVLAYTEPDTFRAEGIRWILDHAVMYHR